VTIAMKYFCRGASILLYPCSERHISQAVRDATVEKRVQLIKGSHGCILKAARSICPLVKTFYHTCNVGWGGILHCKMSSENVP
jgi:hypothetical protein